MSSWPLALTAPADYRVLPVVPGAHGRVASTKPPRGFTLGRPPGETGHLGEMIHQYVVNDSRVAPGLRRAYSDLRRSRELFVALVERQLRARAKRTWMGIVWPIVSPAFLLFLYVFVFQSVFNVPIPHYGWFLFAALLPWTFLVQTLGIGLTCLATEPELIRRSPFPYELIPLSHVAVMALYFLTSLTVFVGFLGVQGHLVWSVLPALVLPV